MSPHLEYVDFTVTAYENRLLVGTITFDLNGDLIDKHFTFDGTERHAFILDDEQWSNFVMIPLQHMDDYKEMYNDLEMAWHKRRQEKEWN